jgi:hypothetical protein
MGSALLLGVAGCNGEAVAVEAHVAKRPEGPKGRAATKKKARPRLRRAFQQNVWQLLVGHPL